MAVDKVSSSVGGLMGSGIAESVAVAGLPVIVRDVDAVACDAASQRLEQSLHRATARGKLDAEGAAGSANGSPSPPSWGTSPTPIW